MLLAIDTSAGTSVAVVARGRVLAEADEPGTRRHAEAIGTLLGRALSEAGIEPRHVTGVVAGMGPGPFTGLRVGIAAARAFAFGVDVPVHPIVSHDAVAYGHESRVLVVTDARRREVAWSLYDPGVVRLEGPELARRRTDELPSEGMVPGALQVPPSGRPTILLADGPVTGGYPVIAVVTDAALDLVAQARPGTRIRFRHARATV